MDLSLCRVNRRLRWIALILLGIFMLSGCASIIKADMPKEFNGRKTYEDPPPQ
jgi:uncharacterized protein YceK